VLLANTDPALVKMELDLFWASISDVDPIQIFEKNPGRFPLCHFKDLAQKTHLSDPLHALDNPASADSAKNAMADLGHGIIDFKSIIAHAEQAGLKHYIVERDLSKDPVTTMKEGYSYLSKALA
jgi:sugar phosphate isomerase/epimerase